MNSNEQPFIPTVWNVFHDGTIDHVEGVVPGLVEIYISVEYLRERFLERGEHFIVSLLDCSLVEYDPYDEAEASTSNLKEIAELSLGILSAGCCYVFTDAGKLRIQAESGSIRLDNGRELSLDELVKVASEYWDDWNSNNS